jgi:hypothetical protein
MKKLIVLFVVCFAGLSALASSATFKTTALTPSTSQTAESYNTGEVITQYFTYETVALMTNGSYVALARVPAQSRILDCEINLEASGVASTNTLGLIAVDGSGFYSLDGSTDADDPDGFLTAFATISPVQDTFASLVNDDLLAGKVVEKDVYIVLDSVAASVDYAVDKTIQGVVRYIR